MALLPWSLAPTEGARTTRTLPGRWLFRAAGRTETRRCTTIVWCCIALFAGIDVAWLAASSLHFDPANWSILASSAKHEKLGANTIQFAVTVPAGGKTKVTYTVEIK